MQVLLQRRKVGTYRSRTVIQPPAEREANKDAWQEPERKGVVPRQQWVSATPAHASSPPPCLHTARQRQDCTAASASPFASISGSDNHSGARLNAQRPVGRWIGVVRVGGAGTAQTWPANKFCQANQAKSIQETYASLKDACMTLGAAPGFQRAIVLEPSQSRIW